MKIRVHLCSSVVGKNWRRKIEGNKTRDRVVNCALRRAGWKVVRIWEHELQRRKHSTPLASKQAFNAQHSTSNAERLVQRIIGQSS